MMRFLRLWFLVGLPANGLIFMDGLSPAANTETAPTGEFVGSGWQHQLRYLTSHATIISPKHFVTATHLGSSQTQVTQASFFNGVEDRVFAVKGVPVRIGDTDLRVFEIWETFDDYALLYTGSAEAGKEMVVNGRGIDRGDEVLGKGWKWGAYSTQKSRWGRNQVDGAFISNGNELLHFDFDNLLGQDEAMVTARDSGGGWFIKDDGVWKLAGVTFAVDATYSDAVDPSDDNDFYGAFYDAGGFYIGGDSSGWDHIPTSGNSNDPGQSAFYRQTNGYGSRISASAAEIQVIIDPAIAWAELAFAGRFSSWLEDFSLTTMMGEGDDPDGDGLSNLEEYLAESDPTSSSIKRRALEVEILPNGIHQFSFIEPLDMTARGLTSTFESSTDLANWDEVRGQTLVSNIRDDPGGVRTRVTTIDPAQSERAFYRLRIILE
jgi:hypothetical protein